VPFLLLDYIVIGTTASATSLIEGNVTWWR